ncbi:alpha-E domain-containing protein, partial [Burkholderia sp. Ax-1720]|nr:alpha-E domain-containing protein [Burkholderia sp. Ax-1720]
MLDRLNLLLSAITGAQTDNMTRDDGWRLLSIGRQIDRVD